MSVDVAIHRPTYQRSGRVNLFRLLVLAPFPLFVAAVMAVCLWLAFEFGYYYSLIVPLVAALPVAAASYLTVRWSHCRNLPLALGIGGLSALVLFPGYFHIHFITMAGPAWITRVDRLPQFIAFRMNTDVELDQRGQPKQTNVVSNWVFFTIELVVVLCTVAGMAAYRASRAFCEPCQRWMRMAIHTAPPGSSNQIGVLLAEGRLHELSVVPLITAGPNQPSCMIRVESCWNVTRNPACRTYLTLQENVGNARSKARPPGTYLQNVEISLEELGHLSSKLSGLAPVAPLGFVAAAPTTVATGSTPAATTTSQSTRRGFVTIEPLPPHTAETIYTKKNTTIAILLSLLPIAAMFIGVGLLVFAWWNRPGPGADPARLALAIGSLIVGLAAVIFGLVICVVNVDYFNAKFGHRITLNEISLRPDAIVKPQDPRAVYVEVVPREHWTELMSDRASDGGFLLVDEAQRQVLFEGVKQRYRIPGSAIQKCETECTQPQAGSMGFFATMIQAPLGSDPTRGDGSGTTAWEGSFMVRPTTFTRFNGAFRRRTCEELRDRIRRIMPEG